MRSDPNNSAQVSRNVVPSSPGVRPVIGFLVAPMVIPPVAFALVAGAWIAGMSFVQADTVEQLADISTTFLLVATMIGYLVTLLVAAPTVLWLVNRNLATRLRVIAIGACLGAAPFVAYFSYVAFWEVSHAAGFSADAPVVELRRSVQRLTRDVPKSAFLLLAGTACGAITAAAFALIAGDSTLRPNTRMEAREVAEHRHDVDRSFVDVETNEKEE
jgi:hypothetical protein